MARSAEELSIGSPAQRLHECPDCGLVQWLPETIPQGYVAQCDRCAATLRRPRRATLGGSLACVVCAAALSPFALTLPLLDIHVMGRFSRAALLTGADVMGSRGRSLLGAVVVTTLVVVPALEIALHVATWFGVSVRRRPRWLPWAFGLAQRLAPYAMIDVFLLGAFVAYSRLLALARVDIGPSVVAAIAIMLALVCARASLDPERVWNAVGPREGARDVHARPLTSCPRCRLLNQAPAGARCSRCGALLRARKAHSVSSTWALVLTGLILYLPANVLPMMYVEHLGQVSASTILGGVVALMNAGAWPLALLVFVASVSVPLLKLVALGAMLVMTHARSTRGLRAATRAHRLVDVVGRWSMLDTFAVSTLTGLVHMGPLATVRPGGAALPFCVLVLVTMFATELFDTRLMWDAAA